MQSISNLIKDSKGRFARWHLFKQQLFYSLIFKGLSCFKSLRDFTWFYKCQNSIKLYSAETLRKILTNFHIL